jgi:hypothetical protein
VREPLRQLLSNAWRGVLIVAAVPTVDEVAHGFGFLGLIDAMRFLHEFVSRCLPPPARLSCLSWFVAAGILPAPAQLDAKTISFMREAFRATELELDEGRSVGLELAVGTASFDGVSVERAVADAMVQVHFDVLTRVHDQSGGTDVHLEGPDFELSLDPEPPTLCVRRPSTI